jgi:uncharacterized protein involved in exopolysaccharide biosynthesis
VVAKKVAAQSASNAPVRFETVSAPTLAVSPSSPNRPALAASGGGAGLLLGALVARFRRRSFPSTA